MLARGAAAGGGGQAKVAGAAADGTTGAAHGCAGSARRAPRSLELRASACELGGRIGRVGSV